MLVIDVDVAGAHRVRLLRLPLEDRVLRVRIISLGGPLARPQLDVVGVGVVEIRLLVSSIQVLHQIIRGHEGVRLRVQAGVVVSSQPYVLSHRLLLDAALDGPLPALVEVAVSRDDEGLVTLAKFKPLLSLVHLLDHTALVYYLEPLRLIFVATAPENRLVLLVFLPVEQRHHLVRVLLLRPVRVLVAALLLLTLNSLIEELGLLLVLVVLLPVFFLRTVQDFLRFCEGVIVEYFVVSLVAGVIFDPDR